MSKNYYMLPCKFSYPDMTFEDMNEIRDLFNELGRPERAKEIVRGTRELKKNYYERTKEYVMDAFRGLVD